MLGLTKSERNLMLVFIWGFAAGAILVQLEMISPLVKVIIYFAMLGLIYIGFMRRRK